MLQWLAQQGIRLTIRIEEPNAGEERGSYYDWPAQVPIMAKIRAVQALVDVEAVIVGNESEGPYDLTWASHNWGNTPDATWILPGGKAQAHNAAVHAMGLLLRPLGVKVISPGWAIRRITPTDPPQPGRMSWRELCAPSYNECDYNGVHIYEYSAISPEDDNRFLWTLGEELARCHRAVWLNEFNVSTGTALERMRACIHFAQLIDATPWADRVQSITPFVSNGTGVGYDPGYVMRDPQCYTELAAWLRL
jgi:hypothetical protein